ncbi:MULTISPECIES: alpha/beta fold hydrolase [Acidiphilium]|uniref:Pimeloyl-ACP methyl ester carboxylesterase n=1 Tax=Acidiphilium rubrum TaxID=526 RepID=A0A8G2CJ24_ACIRU|nr:MULTISPECIES: alpha/beta fold hydrolase [Acidiphilium]SIQ40980.1 Pimeloyl-ACP methyl ester carboxylesterase [Acidiphilium rubrum]
MARQAAIPYLLGADFHRLGFVEFGNPAAPAVMCVHGLTRNGRDFDILAEALANDYHVICPDLPGRGRSDWLADSSLYQPPSYVVALAHLLAYLNKPVAWVGTSLGGICGMMVAAAPHTPITRLVLNDIGPLIPAAALARIRDYMTKAPDTFADIGALEAHLRLVHAPFGRLSDAQWRHLARYSARPVASGGFALHYDPAIADPIRASIPMDADLSGIWQAIRVPVMAIRGEDSDLLTEATFATMATAGGTTLTVTQAGHAPALMDTPTIDAIRDFLARGA